MNELRRATLEDAESIACYAREADINELWAAAKSTPLTTMVRGMEHSEAWTWLIDGVPVCMFGVTPLSILGGYGSPWLVGTHEIDSHAWAFLHSSRAGILELFEQWGHLQNFVDARNTKAIRWLKYLGFTIHPAAPYGPFGLPFHHFEMRRADHV